VTLELSARPGLSAYVNRTLFQQVAGNLVQNALAHTASGGSITVTARLESDNLHLSVADTGHGISREDLPHVLKRFYRSDRVRGSSGLNLGLGLAVVNTIATRHGGHVKIESEVGRGTQVTVTFARVDAAAPNAATAA
jgi:signal transduction histidine kinase